MLRPITQADAPMICRMLARLSPQSFYQRFFTPRSAYEGEITRLAALISQRGGEHVALVSTLVCDGVEEAIAIAELIRPQGRPESGEIALVVHDPYQSKGLGTLLLQRLLDVARSNHLRSMRGIILGENRRMLRLISRSGLPYTASTARGEVLIEMAL